MRRIPFSDLSSFLPGFPGLGISPVYPLEVLNPDMAEAHSNDFFLVMIFQHGTGTLKIESQEAGIKPGCFLFIPRDLTHQLSYDSSARGYFLAFTEEFLNQNLNLDYANFSLLKFTNRFFLRQLDGPQFQETDSLVRYLLQEYNRLDYPLKKMALKYRLGLVLVFLESLLQSESDSEIQGNFHEMFAFRQFEKLVDENFIREKSVRFYAEKLGVSAKKLNDIIREHSSKTILDHLNQRVLLEAKRLLVFTDMPVKGIAYELGFSSDSYFNRFFRKYEGMSGLSFREQNRTIKK